MAKRIATFRKDDELLTGEKARAAWAAQRVRCACRSYGDQQHSIGGTCEDLPAVWLGCTNCRGQALGYPMVYRLPSQMD
jgi:hypothetical protein